MKEIPVILITYNRPSQTEKVLDSLKRHNVKKLFIFSDGPKSENDLNHIYETRLLFQKIDWTDPAIIENDKNLGLANSIVNAVNYVFQKFDKVILLEDDCVPQKYFFDFIETCLDKYCDNENIFGVSGYTVPISNSILNNYPYDLYFYPRIGSWGWATWKSRWQYFEYDLSKAYQKSVGEGIDLEQGGNDIPRMIQKIKDGELKDVWTLNWVLTVYLNRGYYIYPTLSHIENIGLDGSGVHCNKTNRFKPNIADSKPFRFPDDILFNEQIYRNFRKYYDVPQEFRITKKTSNGLPKNIKVVHLSTHDFGGAGIAAYRLHKGLKEIGIDSTLLVLNKKSNDPSVKVLPNVFSGYNIECTNPPTNKSELYLRQKGRWEKLLSKYPQHSDYLELFTDALSDTKLDYLKEIQEADILNFHWVAGTIDFSHIPKALIGKPIIWTLHDMNPFTGGCHYAYTCKKYEKQCKACPLLGSNYEKDVANHNWEQKAIAYRNLDINVVTPSRWLGECAAKSRLFSSFDVKIIPYGLPTNIFKPHLKSEIRRALNIPKKTKIILFGAVSINNLRKGFKYLIEALDKITISSNFEIIILTFGAFPENLQVLSKHSIYSLGTISNELQPALAYSAADVFVLPSLQDNLPNTVIEAMACGVPVVGFDVGGIPDLIEHRKTGFLAKPENAVSLFEGITWVLSSPELHAQLSENCRAKAENRYDIKIQAGAYKQLYENLLKAHQRPFCSIEGLIQKGEEFFHKGNLNEAERKFNEALAIDSKNAMAHNNLAVVYHKQKDKEKAEIHYTRAIEFAPDNMDYKKNLAEFYYVEMGRFEDAIKIYIDLLKINPNDAATLLILGHICFALGNYQNAIHFYQSAIKIEPLNQYARKSLNRLQDNRYERQGL